MREKFTQSTDLFDELSFFLCLIYADLVVNSESKEEFNDFITQSVMEYPVKLPSKNIVDRSTIIKSGYKNPYTREKLEVTDLEPQYELLKNITEWKEKTLKSHNIEKIGSLRCILYKNVK